MRTSCSRMLASRGPRFSLLWTFEEDNFGEMRQGLEKFKTTMHDLAQEFDRLWWYNGKGKRPLKWGSDLVVCIEWHNLLERSIDDNPVLARAHGFIYTGSFNTVPPRVIGLVFLALSLQIIQEKDCLCPPDSRCRHSVRSKDIIQ